MTSHVERSAEWIYRGIWLVITDCFRMPAHPPSLPVESTGFRRTFQPSRKFLKYLKFYFWIVLLLIDLLILAAWIALYMFDPVIAWIAAIPMLAIAVLPDIVAYIAIHLRYDTMWYVITDRSLRARRGIFDILEHTITFENVQNVYVRRGPIQQIFGVSEIVVETAGASEGEYENPFAVGNKTIMQGIDDPEEIRELIMDRVRATRSAGLGDERVQSRSNRLSEKHLSLLCEIRDEVHRLQ